MKWFSTLCKLVLFNLQNIPKQFGTFLVGVVAIAGVVLISIGVMSIAQGFQNALEKSSSEDTVIILRAFSTSEMTSYFLKSEVDLLSQSPGVFSDDTGPLLSPEIFFIVDLKRKADLVETNVPIRGVSDKAFSLRKKIDLIDGRNFKSGRKEVLVGKALIGKFENLELGSDIKLGKDIWRVVGILDSQGGLPDSEIWADAGVIQTSFRKEGAFQTIRAKLGSLDSLELLETWVDTNPRLTAKVVLEKDFYSEQSEFFKKFVYSVGGLIVLFIGIAVIFGVISTMYSIVIKRTKDIALLRTIGFSDGNILASIVIESIIYSIVGSVLGLIISLAFVNGYSVSTLNQQSFTQLTYSFDVTYQIAMIGVMISMTIGLLGGLFPAYLAVSTNISKALRSL